MDNAKKQTVADALNDHFGEFNGDSPETVLDDLKSDQKWYNKSRSHFSDAVRYGKWPKHAQEGRNKWYQRFFDKISQFKYWITGLRITHKDDICNCEDW